MLPALGPARLMVHVAWKETGSKIDGKEAREVSARSSWSRPQDRAVCHDSWPRSGEELDT